jgi:alkylation response protein AidB-like acyl-CoA dehydrogenase
MDFDFTEDQVQLRDAVQRYVSKGYGFERRTAIERAGGFSQQAWKELSELGLPGLCTDADHGGMGLGPIDCMVALEELGRGIVVEPVAQSFIASVLIQRFGTEAIKAKYLGSLASGECVAALAFQERQNRHEMTKIESKVQVAGVQTHLFAIKIGVAAAAHAQAFIVSALHDGKPALFIVEPGAGVQIEAMTDWAGAASGIVKFDGANAQLLTTDGAAALALARDCGVACTCAYAVGAMEQTLALTVEYMNTRKQFNTVLSSFQALRHRVADMKMQLELARSMSYYANLKLGAPDDERSQACSRAKVQLGQSMRAVSQGAVQLHGGIGVTEEYSVSHYFRVLTALEMHWGDTLTHLGEVNERMVDQAGVFV